MSMQLPSWPKLKEILSIQFSFVNDSKKNVFHDHPLIGGGLVISVVFLFCIVFGYFWNLTPVKFNSNQRQVVEVRYGASLREISSLLESKGIIRNRFIYELYVRLRASERMAKSGLPRFARP